MKKYPVFLKEFIKKWATYPLTLQFGIVATSAFFVSLTIYPTVVFIITQDFNITKNSTIQILPDIFKVLIISSLGTIILQKYQAKRQQRTDFKQFKKETAKSLTDIYLKTKRMRWQLRDTCKNASISYSTYWGYIEKLIDIKTEIEVVAYKIEASNEFDSRETVAMKKELDAMESFLRTTIKECFSVETINDSIQPAKCKCLQNFVRVKAKIDEIKETETPFDTGYRLPFKKLLQMLSQKSIDQNSPDQKVQVTPNLSPALA